MTSWAEDENDEVQYIFGLHADHASPVLVVASPTAHGWRCRSTLRDALQHDYVSGERVDELHDWLRLDLRRLYSCSRESALAELASDDVTSTEGGARSARTGFLAPDPALAPAAAAERALRHLERGW